MNDNYSVTHSRHAGPARLEGDELNGGSLRRSHPILWAVTLFGPVGLTVAILAFLWALWGADYMLRLAGTVLSTFFFFGRFVIVLGATRETQEIGEALRNFSAEKLFLLVLYMDVMVATVLSCHVGVLFRLPRIGQWMRTLVEDGRYILETNPWMKRATFIGIVMFVLFPLAATGSVGGSIFGRLLGMSRLATFAGVVIGSFLGCGLMYLGASLVAPLMDSLMAKVTGGLVIAALILFLNARYRKMKARHIARQRAAAGATRPAGLGDDAAA